MKRVLSVLLAFVLIAITICLCISARAYWVAWRKQRAAEPVLSALKMLQPGVTTVAELQRNIFPLDDQWKDGCTEHLSYGDEASLTVYNVASEGFENRLDRLALNLRLSWLMPRWTMFQVSLHCAAGVLVGFDK